MDKTKKSILFLGDGMADEPLSELNGKTPLEAASTPNMDRIASEGISGTMLTLPEGFPTSSDVANMSVLGYSLEKCYSGRGPIEAVSRGIKLKENDIAFRCNLVNVKEGILADYSAGHINTDEAEKTIKELQDQFGSDKLTFYSGVSYRNLLILHGNEFSSELGYYKPDSSQGKKLDELQLSSRGDSERSIHTVKFLKNLIANCADFLKDRENGNYIWPWSPGRKPDFPCFSEKYDGRSAAVISAVDVIKGIAKCAKMDVIEVPGATGFVDTNYKGKADAAVKAAENHDFVYLHVEAMDESSHMGDLKLKMRAIEDFDSKIVGPVMDTLDKKDISFAVLPDHPVPINLRRHTRTPVPVSVCGHNIVPDSVEYYSEKMCKCGNLGLLKGEMLLRLLLGIE